MTFSFVKDPRASFFGILGVTVVIIATFLGGYSMVRKLASFVHDTRGVVAMARGDLATAAGEINLATMYASHDAYHIQLAQLALGDASKLLTGLTESNKQVVSKQAEQVLGIALGHAKAATTQNPLSYKNWVMLGNVYRSAVTLGVSDAVALAKDAYAEAQKRNPSDAALYLNNANLALANKDTAAAYKSIQDSIDLFPTRDAYLLRAQVQIGQQKWSDVVVSLKQAIAMDQSNAPLYVYLGVAYEKSGDSDNANNRWMGQVEVYPLRYKNIVFCGDYMEAVVNGQLICMLHYPIDVVNKQGHGSWMLCGHSHYSYAKTKADCLENKRLDLSWDGHKKPLNFFEVKTIMDRKKVFAVDHHGSRTH
jgi:tetratricopeptide (TPR) repeat protein